MAIPEHIKEEIRTKAGQPMKYQTEDELKVAIGKYFLNCEEKSKPLTLSALAVALDVSRRTITNYGKTDKFFHTIKKAREMCEAYAEECLYTKNSVAGVIFSIKNNYGWVDKQEIQHSGDTEKPISIKVNEMPTDAIINDVIAKLTENTN